MLRQMKMVMTRMTKEGENKLRQRKKLRLGVTIRMMMMINFRDSKVKSRNLEKVLHSLGRDLHNLEKALHNRGKAPRTLGKGRHNKERPTATW